MFSKQVKCCNCGFLGRHKASPVGSVESPDTLEYRKLLKDLGWLDPHEVTQRQRDQMAAKDYEDRIKSSYTVFCIRHVWSEWDFGEEDSEIEEALHKELHSDRKCRLFFRYQASYSPTEHKELQREHSNQWLLIKGMILAALISAAVAIAAQLIVLWNN